MSTLQSFAHTLVFIGVYGNILTKPRAQFWNFGRFWRPKNLSVVLLITVSLFFLSGVHFRSVSDTAWLLAWHGFLLCSADMKDDSVKAHLKARCLLPSPVKTNQISTVFFIHYAVMMLTTLLQPIKSSGSLFSLTPSLSVSIFLLSVRLCPLFDPLLSSACIVLCLLSPLPFN